MAEIRSHTKKNKTVIMIRATLYYAHRAHFFAVFSTEGNNLSLFNRDRSFISEYGRWVFYSTTKTIGLVLKRRPVPPGNQSLGEIKTPPVLWEATGYSNGPEELCHTALMSLTTVHQDVCMREFATAVCLSLKWSYRTASSDVILSEVCCSSDSLRLCSRPFHHCGRRVA